jgi:iron(III) transport system ATP-binding protein
MPAIKFEKVSKRYGKISALEDFTAVFPDNTVSVLLGPSGSGKTTALRLIAGLEKPDLGTVSFDGVIVSQPGSSLPPRKRRIGMVFQNLALWPHMTNIENLIYVMNGISKFDKQKKALELLDLVHLNDKADKYPTALSGGERQRIAISRALAADPQILLLDEPFSSLERTLREDLTGEFKVLLRSRRLTVVYVTHDQEDAFSLAEKVFIIRNGKVQQAGNREDVFFHPADLFTAEFLGYRSFLTHPLSGPPLPKQQLGQNGTMYAYRPKDIIVASTGTSQWRVVDSVFKEGLWLVRLESNGTTLYATSKNDITLSTRVSVETLKPPALIPIAK